MSPARSAVTWSDRKSTRLNSSHSQISYAVFCLKKNRFHFLLRWKMSRYRRSKRYLRLRGRFAGRDEAGWRLPARGLLPYEKERSFDLAKGGDPQEGSFFGWDGVSCSAGEV